MSNLRQSVVIIYVALAAACGGTTDVVCTEHVQPGIVVRIEDSASGEPRAAQVAGTVLAPGYSDSLGPYEAQGNGVLVSRAGAYERPGVYTVSLEGPAYRPWRADEIRVLPGRCHVTTVTLVARLQPTP